MFQGTDHSYEIRSAVLEASARAEVRSAVGEVYARLEEETGRRRPVCKSSGRCCRFDEYGHRLFVTTMELAAFVHDLPAAESGRSDAPCPFQIQGLCSVHAIRPFGCRIFFCDASSESWQREQYERFHLELKRLHEGLGVEYFYVEWRQALAILRGLIPTPGMHEGQSTMANRKSSAFRLALPQLPF